MQQQQQLDPPAARQSPFSLTVPQPDDGSLDTLAACLLQALQDCQLHQTSHVNQHSLQDPATAHQGPPLLQLPAHIQQALEGRSRQHRLAQAALLQAASCGPRRESEGEMKGESEAQGEAQAAQHGQHGGQRLMLQPDAIKQAEGMSAALQQDPGPDADIEDDSDWCSDADTASDTSQAPQHSCPSSAQYTQHAEVRALLEGCLEEAAELARSNSSSSSMLSNLYTSLNRDSSLCSAASTGQAGGASSCTIMRSSSQVEIDWQALLMEELQGAGMVHCQQAATHPWHKHGPQHGKDGATASHPAAMARTASDVEVVTSALRLDGCQQGA